MIDWRSRLGDARPFSIKRSAHRVRPADGSAGPPIACAFCPPATGFVRSIPMGNPWDQWSPYWWQSAMAPRAFRPQPREGWIESGSSWPPPAAPSSPNTGILGQLTQPANESSVHSPPRSLGLLGQLLTGAGMAQATPNGFSTEAAAGEGNYITPAQSRSSNMAHCLPDYVKCHDLHGSSMLRNGKRCEDCFNMCTLYGTWPHWYCPIY
jgi:hypothetical protein